MSGAGDDLYVDDDNDNMSTDYDNDDDVSTDDDDYDDDNDDDYYDDDATAARALAAAHAGEPWRSIIAPASIRNFAGEAGSFLAKIVNCLGRLSGNRAFEEAT